MLDIILDTLIDGAKLLPFLYLTYLAMEYIENKMSDRSVELIRRSGRLSTVIGALLGAVPQCGFSAATASLYAGRVITRGTLIAVFLSTSDEMLPILISSKAPVGLILKIIGFKIVIGMAVGLAIDAVSYRRRSREDIDIHGLCENCGCEDESIFKSALVHTVQIFLFILAVTFVLNIAVEFGGEDLLRSLVLNRPVAGELIAGLIGLIPNCASSVVITQLYLEGGMSFGAMMAGLLTGSGVGILVLFRTNRNRKDNLATLGLLYAFGVVFGVILELLPL